MRLQWDQDLLDLLLHIHHKGTRYFQVLKDIKKYEVQVSSTGISSGMFKDTKAFLPKNFFSNRNGKDFARSEEKQGLWIWIALWGSKNFNKKCHWFAVTDTENKALQKTNWFVRLEEDTILSILRSSKGSVAFIWYTWSDISKSYSDHQMSVTSNSDSLCCGNRHS